LRRSGTGRSNGSGRQHRRHAARPAAVGAPLHRKNALFYKTQNGSLHLESGQPVRLPASLREYVFWLQIVTAASARPAHHPPGSTAHFPPPVLGPRPRGTVRPFFSTMKNP
jgi:hypothetical protein